MFKFILRRLLETIPVLWAIATVTFFMIRLAPGGPFTQERQVSPEIIRAMNEHYGLNDPWLVQYGHYLKNLLKGDLGPSYTYPGRTVTELIGQGFPVSLELGAYALVIAILIGLTLGLLAALRKNSPLDYASMSLAMLGICLPTFVLGPLLALIFGLKLGWCHVSGWTSINDKVLPSLTLGLFYAAYIARLTRTGMLEVLNQDFIRAARAKGC
ncbi:MAG TPA: ABC transporter permease, partial [Opitutales bacterium]|nr:ABC transporter permease [Opitutales bacterium]